MMEWCEPDGCPAVICGGPHIKIIIQDGDEVTINKDQADRLEANGDMATYKMSLADLMAIIQPGR